MTPYQETRVVLTSSNEDGNTPSEFSTHLLKPLNFTSGKWKVALSEISIPKCPVNFNEEDFIIFETFVLTSKNGLEVVYSQKVTFDSESIFSHETLIIRINEMLRKYEIHKYFSGKIELNDKTFKMSITLHRGEKIILSHRLSLVLSMETVMQNHNESEKTFQSKYCVDVRLHFWNLYIYANLNKPVILGEKLSPLLQTLSLESFENRILTKSYNPP